MEMTTKRINEIIPNPDNPRSISSEGLRGLTESLRRFGVVEPIVVNKRTGYIVGGHQRLKALQELGVEETPVVLVDLDEKEEMLLNVSLNNTHIQGDWSGTIPAVLEGLQVDFPEEFKALCLDTLNLEFNVNVEDIEFEEPEPEEPDERAPTMTVLGDLWTLGKHRLLCGDSTNVQHVERLMEGECTPLLHCDPPYGMGKKGIENDNLYRSKLDAFQMEWFSTALSVLDANASVYIWGNAEDLWRLWFSKLSPSMQLTFRNEIVWSKGSAQGMLSDTHRMYPTGSERCLFFMLGEQGFNTNADNYWEGWEPIRKYLEEERLRMGWDVPTMKKIVGHSDLSRDHWTSKSQWSFIPRYCYEKLQGTAKGEAFKKDYDELKKDYDELKKDYDELKKDFYNTRTYFNNTHDGMTDVWDFPVPAGKERPDHPTPKPVPILERVLKSSSPEGSSVLDLFGGSGTTLIAAERTGRRSRLMEISPTYCDVIVRRYVAAFGTDGVLLNGKSQSVPNGT